VPLLRENNARKTDRQGKTVTAKTKVIIAVVVVDILLLVGFALYFSADTEGTGSAPAATSSAQ
jgi:hypothetical protein